MMSDTCFPVYLPGLWRRIVLQPGQGWIGCALEDDIHRFHLRMDHKDGRITSVAAKAVRHPWTGCVGAAPHLVKSLTGELLSDVAALDATQQCTHLFDLAILCAAHANDTRPTRFDMRVADRVDERTTATLEQDGIERLRWQLEGTIISGPEEFAGKDVKRVSRWKSEFAPDVAEWSVLLRRTIFISGARDFEIPHGIHASEMGPTRMGVCFNYQLPQAEESSPLYRLRDFSMSRHEPLEGFDAKRELAALGLSAD